uniref:Serine/threonine-protein kinase BRI1-like 2 n=1 Tax=Cajanus cajan TaxID=3821 RepID=A0A151SZR0_CAJCA|nr:Serine/threonine-protein kinase BRI1-like 2 [Cajanus cajan]
MGLLFQVILSLHLLLFHFLSSHSSQPLCPSDQSHALLRLKTSFTSNTEHVSGACNQTHAKTKTWENDTNCCSWLGVTCDPISGHVIGLNLSCSGLQGKLHPNNTLFRLTRLQSLDLAFNDFSKSHLLSLFGDFVNLMHLNLSSSNFEGEIPFQISQLQNLIHLNLSFNKFSGSIPNVFGGLTKLKTLDLTANNLEGQIPSSLFNSTQLSGLNCSYNKLEGPLPNKITGLSKLIALRLNNNLLNGTIPAWCFSLPSLIGIDLSNNQFTGHINAISAYSLEFLLLCNNKLQGNIPKSIFNLVNLTGLCLSSNELSSNNLTEFPKLLGKFSSLSCLEMSDNKFIGKIPNWLYEMDSLQILNLSRNLLTTSMDQFSWNYRLHVLDLSFNLLAGDISSSICNLSSLQILNLSHNRLKGTIPPCLVNLLLFPSLTILDISYNDFSGSLPLGYIKNLEAMKNPVELENSSQYVEFNYIIYSDKFQHYSLSYDSMVITMKGVNLIITRIPTKLATLDLSANSFEGKIPYVLGKLKALRGLNLSHNKLMGTIPSELGNLTNLESLDLSSNLLTGGIPMELTNLNYLAVLNLSHNHLVGEIPQGKQFNTFSNDSYVGNMGLCGLPLSTKCDMKCKQCSSASPTFSSEEKFGFGWKPVAVGYGCGMAFGVALGCCVLLMGKPLWLVRMVEVQPTKRVTRRARKRPRRRMNVQMS